MTRPIYQPKGRALLFLVDHLTGGKAFPPVTIRALSAIRRRKEVQELFEPQPQLHGSKLTLAGFQHNYDLRVEMNGEKREKNHANTR